MRTQVFDVSGQYYVPVLKDGDTVLTETRDILSYLDQHYTEKVRSERPAIRGSRQPAAFSGIT